ncbi:unnamed protein product [Cunninghamella blakesleeana]
MTTMINTLKEEYTVIETGFNDSTITNEKNQLMDYIQPFHDEQGMKVVKKMKKSTKPLYSSNNTTTTISSLSTPTLSTIKSTKSYLKQQYIYFSSLIYPLPTIQNKDNVSDHHQHQHHHHSIKTLTLEQKYGKIQSKTVGRGGYANVKLIINNNYNNNNKSLSSSSLSLSKTLVHYEKSFYAVKIFKKRKYNGKTMKKLISEYCIASTMDHPNICSGGDLYRAIERDQLTLCKMKSYFKQLLLGLDYLHSLGVAHRDIKPENLMISKDGKTLKITDFGVAEVFCEKWQKHSRLSSGFCGSLAFIAPEIFLNHKKGYQAIQADVWSAAIVFCCMWFKGTLFKFAEKNDYHYRLFLKSYPTRTFKTLLSMNDLNYRSLIYLMLNPNPSDRIQISDILKLPFISNLII